MQAYGLGSKAELLVAVRQPEGPDGPTTVQLTSDLATSAVLHWGVRRGTSRGEWLRPPDEVLLTPDYLCWAYCHQSCDAGYTGFGISKLTQLTYGEARGTCIGLRPQPLEIMSSCR